MALSAWAELASAIAASMPIQPRPEAHEISEAAHRLLLQLVAHVEVERRGLPAGLQFEVPEPVMGAADGPDAVHTVSWTDWQAECAHLVQIGSGGESSDSGLSLFRPLAGVLAEVQLPTDVFSGVLTRARDIADRLATLQDGSPEQRLGMLHELLLESTLVIDDSGCAHVGDVSETGQRAKQGSYFTPQRLVRYVAAQALLGHEDRDPCDLRICDPACGSGNILLAVARLAAASGASGVAADAEVRKLIASGCYGVDSDATAVDICRVACWLAAGCDPDVARTIADHVIHGDALLGVTPKMLDEAVGPAAFQPAPGEDTRLVARIARSLTPVASEGQLTLIDDPPAGTSSERREPGSMFAGLVTPVTPATFEAVLSLLGTGVPGNAAGLVAQTEHEHHPVHWQERFPLVFSAARGTCDARAGWQGGFDIVAGNPPFLSQLATETATARHLSRLLSARYAAGGTYTNPATLFLLLGSEIAREGGTVVMVQPESVLAARDSGAARRQLSETCTLKGLWLSAGDRLFSAAVNVCVLGFAKRLAAEWTIKRSSGAEFVGLPMLQATRKMFAGEASWSFLAAAAHGIPELELTPSNVLLEDCAEFSADFRDQYYGLIPYVREGAGPDDPTLRLATVGLIDLAWDRWGIVPATFGKRKFDRPTVGSEVFSDANLGRWARQRAVPKVMVATQTRILECVVDGEGAYLPSVPVVSAIPTGCTVWELAAAIGSPVLSAMACARWTGAGMSSGALKVSARQLRELPAPSDPTEWARAARLFQCAQEDFEPVGRDRVLADYGRVACRAYGLAPEAAERLLAWWLPLAVRARPRDS